MPTNPKKITGAQTPILNPGNLPIVRTGTWHSLPPYGAASNINVPDGRMFGLPLWPGRRCSATGVAMNVTLAAVGGNLRIGVYSSANGLPSKLVQEIGLIPVGLIGIQTLTGFTLHLQPRLYFLSIVRQGGALNLGLSTRDTWEPIVSESSPTLMGNLNAYYVDGVAGALPTFFGTVAGTIQGPSASVQLT